MNKKENRVIKYLLSLTAIMLIFSCNSAKITKEIWGESNEKKVYLYHLIMARE